MDRTYSSDVATEAEPRFLPSLKIKGPPKARFEAVFNLGKRVKGNTARVIAAPGTGLIGIAVSKKIGSHSRRNRLKRRFREAIRSQAATLNLQFDFVVVVNVEADRIPFPQIESEIRELMSKVVERWAAE